MADNSVATAADATTANSSSYSSDASNDNDKFLKNLERQMGYGRGKLPKNTKTAALAMLGMFSEEAVTNVFMSTPPKRKAEEAFKTRFVLTYQQHGDERLATKFDFDVEPSASDVRAKLKSMSSDSSWWPLYYYDTALGTYCHVPHQGPLPESMLEDEGRILLVTSIVTPTKAPPNATAPKPIESSLFSTQLCAAFDKAMPPNLRCPALTEKFNAIPVLFKDQTLAELVAFLSGEQDENDRQVSVFFAVPGAGKTRTILESCRKAVGNNFTRVKLSDGVLEKKFLKIVREKEEEFRSADYSAIKGWFIQTAEDYLEELKGENSGSIVIHFDEVQQLMGHCVVSSNNFGVVRKDATLRDFFMPAFCDAIHSFTSGNQNPHVIMSGTNFFSPLAFNPGSSLKVKDDLHIHGRFPSRWVIDKVLKKYFVLDVLEEDPVTKSAFESIIEYVSANRRVVQFFLRELRKALACKDTRLSKKELLMELSQCTDTALGHWTKGCLEYTSSSCMTALALCVFPDTYGGSIGKTASGFPKEYMPECPSVDAVIMKEDDLPNEVKTYANAGGLNIWKHSDTEVAVEIPVGCLRANLLKRCHSLSTAMNAVDIAAIRNYRNKVDPKAKGHLFERAFAFELTTFGSNIGELICDTLSTGGRKMKMDGRIFGSKWVFESLIIQNWKDGKMHCVFEKEIDKGNRIVDVGFPVVNVVGDEAGFWRVYCELKCGYEIGSLWEECSDFLKAISEHVEEENQRSCAIFVASRSFVDGDKLKEGCCSAKAKQFVTTHKLYKKRFFILDGSSLAGKSILHLSDMHGELADSELPISPSASRVDRDTMYTSDSQMPN